MSSRTTRDLQAKVTDLERQLAAARASLDLLLRESGSSYWEINSLLSRLQSDLLNPISAIISNTELLPEVFSDRQRASLCSATKLAALRLEDALLKIVDLATATSSNVKLGAVKRSIRSITHESLLLAVSLLPPDRAFEHHSSFDGDDAIVDIDAVRLTHLIATVFVSLHRRYQFQRTQVSLRVDAAGQGATLVWRIAILSGRQHTHLSDIFRLPSPDDPMAARSALDVLFVSTLSTPLNTTVSVSDDQSSIEITASLPLVRTVQAPDALPTVLTSPQQTIVVVDEPPPTFTPLGTVITPKPIGQDINEFLTEIRARLLILHQPADDERIVSANLVLCRQVRVPVLLRAASLTYDQYSRYRGKLDAILMEPSDSATLARYIAGLCSSEKRVSRRDAEIH